MTARTVAPRRTIRRCVGDDGTALIECGIALPILAVIVGGIFDFGMLFRQTTVINGAKQASIRTLANSGSARSADFLALRSFATNFSSTRNVTLVKVVVFQPQTEGSQLPVSPSCFTSATPTTSAQCNVYTAAQVHTIGATYTAHFGPDSQSCGSTAWDKNWCPLSRIDWAQGPPDWVGVYVQATFKSFTGFWMPSGFTITDRSVMRIEPKTGAL